MYRLVVLPLSCVVLAAAAQPLGPKPTLHTPDAIAPAVLPYLACLYGERGLPLLRASDGAQVPFDHSDKDCAVARAKAKADAIKLLEAHPAKSGGGASAFVDQTLSDMDTYVASLPMPQATHEQQSAVIGIPVTIEDEVQPAYARYDECLKTQVSGSPVTAETVIDKFRQAMSVCTSVRDLAVAEAKKALSAKGWDEATRGRAAASTFAKVDESWLAMGRQYREALMQKALSRSVNSSGATRKGPKPQ